MRKSEYYGHWTVLWFRLLSLGLFFFGIAVIILMAFLSPAMDLFRFGFFSGLMLPVSGWLFYSESKDFKRETRDLRTHKT